LFHGVHSRKIIFNYMVEYRLGQKFLSSPSALRSSPLEGEGGPLRNAMVGEGFGESEF
jgi:hypothetical protein